MTYRSTQVLLYSGSQGTLFSFLQATIHFPQPTHFSVSQTNPQLCVSQSSCPACPAKAGVVAPEPRRRFCRRDGILIALATNRPPPAYLRKSRREVFFSIHLLRWQFVQVALVRPAWSAGKGLIPPELWHSKHSERPSRV